jgi:hypothetical protein
MKSIETIISQYKSQTLDGRDISRLLQFLTEEQITSMGMELKEEYKGKHQPVPFTKENILKQLEKDVAFGFEKALNQRGISSGLMYSVVQMWNWVLEEGLEDFDEYPMYGLPLFKATAVKYGFENPIGDDEGSERKYDSE